jgi:hypothetical protein
MLRMTVSIPPEFPGLAPGVADRVMNRFSEEAGKLVVEAIREVLGTEALDYQLSASYAIEKPKKKGFKRFPNKEWSQPLIFSGEGIFNALTSRIDGASVIVEVEASHGVSERGFDYAEKWEEATEFLEKGFADVEDQLGELMGRIIVEEMGL